MDSSNFFIRKFDLKNVKLKLKSIFIYGFLVIGIYSSRSSVIFVFSWFNFLKFVEKVVWKRRKEYDLRRVVVEVKVKAKDVKVKLDN